MPVVPGNGLNRIATAALPTARTQSFANEETFGGGQNLQRVTQAAGQLVGAFQEAKQNADATRVQDAAATLLNNTNNLKYGYKDPSGQAVPGLFTKKGKDSFTVVEEGQKAYDKNLAEQINSLSNDDQKQMLKRYGEAQRNGFLSNLQQHQFTETQEYEKQVIASGIDANSKNAIYNLQDPKQVAFSLNEQARLVKDLGQREGWDSDRTNLKILEVTSKTRSAIIQQMADNKNYPQAQKYFEQQRPSMDPEIAAQVDKTLHTARVDYEGGNLAGDIYAKHRGSVASMMAEIQKIPDEDTRKEARSRVSEFATIDKMRKEENNERALGSALSYAEKGQEAPPSLLSAMPYDAAQKYRTRLKQVRTGDDVGTDINYYGQLLQLRAEDPQKFAATPLDYSRLGVTDRKKFTEYQKGNITPEDSYTNSNEMAVIKNTWRENGFTVDSKNKDVQAKFGLFLRKFSERKAALGAKSNQVGTQAIVDQLFTEGAVENPGVFFGTNTTQKRGFEIEYKEIPATEKDMIVNSLKANGKTVSEKNVLDLYIRGLKRGE